jgi:hypothetical protein
MRNRVFTQPGPKPDLSQASFSSGGTDVNRRAPVAIRLIQNDSDLAQGLPNWPYTLASVRQNVLWNQGGKVTE